MRPPPTAKLVSNPATEELNRAGGPESGCGPDQRLGKVGDRGLGGIHCPAHQIDQSGPDALALGFDAGLQLLAQSAGKHSEKTLGNDDLCTDHHHSSVKVSPRREYRDPFN